MTPVQNISITTVLGRFFTNPTGDGAFTATPPQAPVFTQVFPTINFNPPAGRIPGNTSGVDPLTRPFTDVTTDPNGNFTGTIVAQGNGLQAGAGALATFQAVFTGSFTVASAGDVVFHIYNDDGFVLGIGGGATRVAGFMVGAPPSGFTAFENLPVVGALNIGTGAVARLVQLHFPAAGAYPFELDYSECCLQGLSLTMTASTVNGDRGLAPSGSLTLSPNTVAAQTVGATQTFTVQASDASGAGIGNLGVALIISGANGQQLSALTDASGRATFTYTGSLAGDDSMQAIATVSGMGASSNLVTVHWNPATSTLGPTVTLGWFAAPTHRSLVSGQVQIFLNQTVSQSTIDYWPASNPADVRLIQTTGLVFSGSVLAIFDSTVVPNGDYVLRVSGTDSSGNQQVNLVQVTVVGENKPGRFTSTVTDLRVPLSGLAIEIQRRYDSLERAVSSDFGLGWSLSIGTRLQVDLLNNVTFTMYGRRVTFRFTPLPQPFPFVYPSKPVYTPEPGTYGTLTADGCQILYISNEAVNCYPEFNRYQPTTYTYTDASGRVFTMGADGSLKSIRDLNGNTLTVTANGITSTAGGVNVPFVRDGSGRITQITDPAGNLFRYSYDAAGNLTTVTLPGIATPVTYSYDITHRLTQEVDPRGNSSTSTYYPDGRLQSITTPAGTTQFAYNLTTNTTTIANPDGGVVTEVRDSFGMVTSRTEKVTATTSRTTSYTYDANHNRLTETNGLGKITTYTYDANGFRTSVKDPLGNTTTAVYNQVGGPTTLTDALNQTQTITYNGLFNPAGITDSLGTLGQYTWDAKGNLTTWRDANAKQTQFAYDAFGNPITRTDPLGGITRYAYDPMGLLLTVTDARNNITRYTYDGLGNRLTITDALNGVTRYEYDANGNKTAEIDALGRRTTFTYDAANRLTRTTFPDTSFVSSTSSATRLVRNR